MGTVRGDLVRALLIQIQKTKVDVELAVSGIDALLKSQELVFGWILPIIERSTVRMADADTRFVGLAPGILVSLSVSRWLAEVFAGRKEKLQGRKQGSMIRILRWVPSCALLCMILNSAAGTLIGSWAARYHLKVECYHTKTMACCCVKFIKFAKRHSAPFPARFTTISLKRWTTLLTFELALNVRRGLLNGFGGHIRNGSNDGATVHECLLTGELQFGNW